jgi:Lrp/AsnC family leucine-responsive transcriptional regulator
MTEKMDEVDIKIMRILQEDSRVSLDDISSKLHISKSTVHYRVKKLVSSGVIKGFSAIIDPEKVGKEILCATLVKAKYKPDCSPKMGQELSGIRGVWAVYFLLGEYDFLILSRAENQKDLKRIIEEIISLEIVEKSSTQVVLNTIKEDIRVEL